MGRSISDLASPDVDAVLAGSATAVIPLGSTEQHGPHLPCGTDTMAAELIAAEVAGRLDGLLVPFGPYGVTPIHAGHPGTISLSRQTFEGLLGDICEDLVAMGARWLVLINWHEGNIASMDAVAADLQDRHPGVFVVSAHACYVAQEMFADAGGELTHGGGIETLAVMAHDPGLVRWDRAGRPSRSPRAGELDAMRRRRTVHGYITDVTEIDAEGWYGDPGWARDQDAEAFAGAVAAHIVKEVEAIRSLRADRR